MRRRLLVVVLLAAVAAAAYWLRIRDTTVESHLRASTPTATIGSGAEAVAVGPDGQILAWFPLSEDAQLPRLPISEPPEKGELGGAVLAQARVLGAAPADLRPYLERSYYGESGIDVELRSGIELRFGDASQAALKWKAVAAVLADPSVEALDYVNVSAPRRPSVGGSGHALPAPE